MLAKARGKRLYRIILISGAIIFIIGFGLHLVKVELTPQETEQLRHMLTCPSGPCTGPFYKAPYAEVGDYMMYAGIAIMIVDGVLLSIRIVTLSGKTSSTTTVAGD
jgi:hypothetical protein